MNNKYRVNWQPGMRLTDAIFRTADEYQNFRQQPIYALLAAGGYGFLEVPIIRYEMSESFLSFIEIQAYAVCHSGKFISLHFQREQSPRFQNVEMPDTMSPVIAYIDITSDKTITIADSEDGVPLCDDDYRIIIKQENEHYSNPDAVPFTRFIYNHGWEIDSSFIAPCLTLRANGSLLRSANEYASELKGLIGAFKSASRSDYGIMLRSLIPVLSAFSVEVDKEADSMTPAHLIAIMQRVINVVLAVADLEEGVKVPECDKCKSFVESYYSPYSTSYMVTEGIRLTKMLVDMTKTFGIIVRPAEHPVPQRPHTEGTRGRINHQGTSFRK